MEIAVIGTEETVTAFRLGGVGRIYSETEANKDLQEILADKNIGVLVVTENFAATNRKTIEKHRVSDVKTPVVVEVPDASGHLTEKEDPIDLLLKRAIGAEISD